MDFKKAVRTYFNGGSLADEWVEDDEEYDAYEDYEEEDNHSVVNSRKEPQTNRRPETSNNKVVSLFGNVKPEIVRAEPKTVDEATAIVKKLRDNKACMVVLEGLDHKECQRIIDFLVGATFALNGDLTKPAANVLLILPNTFGYSGDLELKVDSIITSQLNYGN